jgi:hypothetical protein
MYSDPYRLSNELIFNAVSMASNQTSVPLDIAESGNCSLNAYWTGTSPVGSLVILGSNGDSVGKLPASNDPSWATVSTTAISGNSGSVVVNLAGNNRPSYYYIMFQYTSSSGTGSLTARFAEKKD